MSRALWWAVRILVFVLAGIGMGLLSSCRLPELLDPPDAPQPAALSMYVCFDPPRDGQDPRCTKQPPPIVIEGHR